MVKLSERLEKFQSSLLFAEAESQRVDDLTFFPGRKMRNFLGPAHSSFLLGAQILRNAAKIGPQTAFAEHAAAFFGLREPVSMMKVAQKERPS